MPSVINRLRRQYPYLTPGIFPDNDEDSGYLPAIRRMSTPGDTPLETSAEINPNIPMRRVPSALESMPEPPPPMEWEPIVRRKGRPAISSTAVGDPEHIQRRYRQAVEGYEPQEQSWKSILGESLLQFPMSGLLGVGMNIAGRALDRRAKDRAWKDREIERSGKTIGRLRDDRRAELQDRLIESQIAENEAQAGRRPAPVYKGRIVDKDEFPGVAAGSEIRQEFDPKTGQTKDVIVNGRPVVTRAPRPRTSGTPHPSTRIVAAGEFEGIPAGTEIRTIWNGEEYEDQIRNGKPIIATTKPFTETGEESPQQRRERRAQYRAAQKEFSDLVEAEKRAAAKKDAAYAKASTLRDAFNNPSEPEVKDPKTGQIIAPAKIGRRPVGEEPTEKEVLAAEAAAEEAQKDYEKFAGLKSAAEAKMLQYQDTEDGKDPQIQAYADKFFKGDYAAAEAAIKKQRGQ